MSSKQSLRCALLGALALGTACEGRQYVSPDTVALTVTRQGIERLRQCHYIPVLLGSRVLASYPVEGELSAVIDVTRDTVTLDFDGADERASLEIPSKNFEAAHSEQVEVISAGKTYTAVLSSPCEPDD
jgi:hypothetical protein